MCDPWSLHSGGSNQASKSIVTKMTHAIDKVKEDSEISTVERWEGSNHRTREMEGLCRADTKDDAQGWGCRSEYVSSMHRSLGLT